MVREEGALPLLDRSLAILLLLLALGLWGKNGLVVVSAAIVIGLKVSGQSWGLSWLTRAGIDTGLTFMTLAVLAPLASGEVAVGDFGQHLVDPAVAFGLLGGVLAAWVCARGIELLRVEPQVIVALVVGSILGATFADGVPVGPLFAAGLTAIFLYLFRWFAP
jgi:uncharacterized membrane protein (DUF441 family)